MTDAVTLVIKGGQGKSGQLVAQTALGDPSPADRGQGHQTLLGLSGRLVVHVVALLAVHGSLLLYLIHKGRDEGIHLNGLSREDLRTGK